MVERIPATLTKLVIPIDQVQPATRNPRRGDVEVIAESLERNGQYRPIVVNRPTGQILAGNHTWRAAKSLDWEKIAVTFVDVDEDDAARIMLADNRTADLGGYDDALIATILKDLDGDLVGTGYSEDDLSELIDTLDGDEGSLDPDVDLDDVPDLPPEPTTRPGDVWQLGPHLVACGDSTEPTAFDALLGDRRVQLVWTDPPYGVDYADSSLPISRVSKTRSAELTISNDKLTGDGLTTFLRASLSQALRRTQPGAHWYVTAPPGPQFLAFGTVLTELDVWRQTLAWVKNALVFGRSDFHYRHEPIFYGWTPGAARLHPVPDRSQTTVLEFDRPSRSVEHPTMKPVDLIAYCLRNSSKRGEMVLDPFGGSGSTLIAAESTGRIARLIELDPRYVDVICRRYQQLTGKLPILAATGESHDFT